MPKWLDLPPLWLILMMALVSIDATMIAPWPGFPMPWLGGAVMVAGVLLAIWAALGFRQSKTTIIPHQTASALITTGAFAYSRNPIYLADAIVLIGWVMIFGAALPLVFVILFVLIINVRFIRPEERRLGEAFGDEFAAYASTVRRWI